MSAALRLIHAQGSIERRAPELPHVDAWPEQIPCRATPDAWFTDDLNVAMECLPCPARVKCAAAALDNFEKHGIWAGIILGININRSRLRLEVIAGRRAEESTAVRAMVGTRVEQAAAARYRAQLHAEGLTDREISNETDVDITSIQKWRTKAGLPINSARKARA